MKSSLGTRLLTAAVALPILLCLIIFLPQNNHLCFSLIIIVVNAIGTYELHNNILKKNSDVLLTGYLAVLLPVIELLNLRFWHIDNLLLFSATALLGISFFVEVLTGDKDNFKGSINRVSSTVLTICYPSLFMAYGIRLCYLEPAVNSIIVFLAIVFGSDSLAYFSGLLFGKNNKGYVKCSPNKSIAGFIGGTIGLALIMSLLVFLFPSILPLSPLKMLLLSFITAVFGTLGDLFESMLKRSSGIKDSGTIVPGRGGMLDCIDSISMALPVFTVLFSLLV